MSSEQRMAFSFSPRLILDDLTVRDLRLVLGEEDPVRAAFTVAGFTIHYWRPAAPASMHNGVEAVFEHPASGLWFTSRISLSDSTNTPASLLIILDSAIRSSWSSPTHGQPNVASLNALIQCVATGASGYTGAKMGEQWEAGGLLLGCLRVLDTLAPDDSEAMRVLVGLTDSHLLAQIEQLAQWQENVSTDRSAAEADALATYIAAGTSMWPQFVGAKAAAHDLKPDRLLCYPRAEWPTRAIEIFLDAVVRGQGYVLRPLEASWNAEVRHRPSADPGPKFSIRRLLDLAIIPDDIRVPDIEH